MQSRGQKPLEFVVGGLLLFVAAAYIVELIFRAPTCRVCWKGHSSPASPMVMLSSSCRRRVGATVMPHVIYLHSAPTQHTQEQGTVTQRLHSTRVDVAIAMTIAGFVNLAMMAMAAAAFHSPAISRWPSWKRPTRPSRPAGPGSRHPVRPSWSPPASPPPWWGTLAGQVVMQGFVRFTIPLWLRRAITMAPAFVVIAMGPNTTEILVLSQVVLSFGIALALFRC